MSVYIETPENRRGDSHHSSSSTLNVLAFENMLSYAPIRVRIVSTGQILVQKEQISVSASIQAGIEREANRALEAGTNIPSWAIT